ncbi:MAG: CrcB family protein [Oligoflexia bacterium]|nr:CrcB family protein [Oligoflexia bacterium]
MRLPLGALSQLSLLVLFGSAGVLSRYGLDRAFLKLGSHFPWGTLTINIVGSFLAGVGYVLGVERGALPAELRTAVMVGFLGGFTTFSAFSLQAARLLEERHLGEAFLYLVVSPGLGLGACLLGLWLARS